MRIPTIEATVEAAHATPLVLGESPFWHVDDHVLQATDIPGRRLVCLDPRRAGWREWPIDTEVGSLAPIAQSADLLLACRDGLFRFDPSSGERVSIAAPPYDPAEGRFNDGKCGPDGAFWIGTLFDDRRPEAALYRFDGTTLARIDGGITTSNGLAWSPDGRTLYWSDTAAHTVYAFDADPSTGAVRNRRVFASFPRKTPGLDLSTYGGRPDGAAVDAEGCYWIAMFEGQRLLRLSPAGEVLGALPLPVRCPTMPCFGGDDGRTLFITTAREKRPADELAAQPLAGCILQVRVEVPGLPTLPFRGFARDAA